MAIEHRETDRDTYEFSDNAERCGWTETTRLELLLRFIAKVGLDDALAEWSTDLADEELGCVGDDNDEGVE